MRTLRVAAAIIVLGLLSTVSSACDDGDGGSSDDPLVPEQAIKNAQMAAREAGGYTVRMLGHNLVLPQWGGIDGVSTVEVASDRGVARATLVRTGEPDATYEVVLVDNETFFKRST